MTLCNHIRFIAVVLLISCVGTLGCQKRSGEGSGDSGGEQGDQGDLSMSGEMSPLDDLGPSPDAGGESVGGDMVTTNTPLSVESTRLDFGQIPLGESAQQTLMIRNDGDAQVTLERLVVDQDAFQILPNAQVIIEARESLQVTVTFTPISLGVSEATLALSGVFSESGEAFETVEVELSAEGVEASGVPELTLGANILDFGVVARGDTIHKTLVLKNTGGGVLRVSELSIVDLEEAGVEEHEGSAEAFTVINESRISNGQLAPDQLQPLMVSFSPAREGVFEAQLNLESGGESHAVTLRGFSAPPISDEGFPPPEELRVEPSEDNPLDVVNAASVSAARVSVSLPPTVTTGDVVQLLIRDHRSGVITAQVVLDATQESQVVFTLDLTTLADGPLILEAKLMRGEVENAVMSAPITHSAVKHTSQLPAPTVEPPLPTDPLLVTSSPSFTLTGSTPCDSALRVFGGSREVSQEIAVECDGYEIAVPLRVNQSNTLTVCAERGDELACAAPVQLTHLDPFSFLEVEASSRRLGPEEVEQLVEQGVIDLDDPDNYQVSEFVICLGIGTDLCYSEIIAVPVDGSGCFGSGCGLGGEISGESCSRANCPPQLVVIRPTPESPSLPGLVFIDGKIKTLKEFFQVTFVLANLSPLHTIDDLVVSLELPPSGVTSIAAATGTDLEDVSDTERVDVVPVGQVPSATEEGPGVGSAQFIVRGDDQGVYPLNLYFGGEISGEGLAEPVPFESTLQEWIQVVGKPPLGLKVYTPHDVVAGRLYDVIFEVTNLSPYIPLLYTSVELGFGQNIWTHEPNAVCQLPESELAPIPPEGCCNGRHQVTYDVGYMQPLAVWTRAVPSSFCVTGPVVSCSFVHDENIAMEVHTRVECQEGYLPVPTEDSPLFPSLFITDYYPAPGGVIEVESFTGAELSFSSDLSGVVGDTLINPIYAEDGTTMLNADVVPTGNIYIEALSPFGSAVAERIPSVVTITAGTSAANRVEVRPLRGALRADRAYRVTVRGGAEGPLDAQTGRGLASDFQLLFRTSLFDDGAPLEVVSTSPMDGRTAVSTRAAVIITMSRSVDPASLSVSADDPNTGTVALIAGASLEGERLVGGEVVPARVSLQRGRVVVIEPLRALSPSASHIIRVDGLLDPLGGGMSAPFFSSFTTGPSTDRPAQDPLVNPLPRYTSSHSVIVSGRTSPFAEVTVSGASMESPEPERSANWNGDFAVEVALTPNTDHTLTVSASAAGGASEVISTDTSGAPLIIGRDVTPPELTLTAPSDGMTISAETTGYTVTFSGEATDPFGAGVERVEVQMDGGRVAETRVSDGVWSVEVDTQLIMNGAHDFSVYAIDTVGNWSAVTSISLDIDHPLVPRLTRVTPAEVLAGEDATLTLEGVALANAEITLDHPEITVTETVITESGLRLTLDVPLDARLGPFSLTLTRDSGEVSTAPDFDLSVVAPIPPAITFFGDYQGEFVSHVDGFSVTRRAGRLTLISRQGQHFRADALVSLNGELLAPEQVTRSEPYCSIRGECQFGEETEDCCIRSMDLSVELPEGRLAQPENLTFQVIHPDPFHGAKTSAPLSVTLASGQINLSSPLIDEDSGQLGLVVGDPEELTLQISPPAPFHEVPVTLELTEGDPEALSYPELIESSGASARFTVEALSIADNLQLTASADDLLSTTLAIEAQGVPQPYGLRSETDALGASSGSVTFGMMTARQLTFEQCRLTLTPSPGLQLDRATLTPCSFTSRRVNYSAESAGTYTITAESVWGTSVIITVKVREASVRVNVEPRILGLQRSPLRLYLDTAESNITALRLTLPEAWDSISQPILFQFPSVSLESQLDEATPRSLSLEEFTLDASGALTYDGQVISDPLTLQLTTTHSTFGVSAWELEVSRDDGPLTLVSDPLTFIVQNPAAPILQPHMLFSAPGESLRLYQGPGWIPLQQIAWDWPLHTPDDEWILASNVSSRAEATTLISDLSWLPLGPFIHWESDDPDAYQAATSPLTLADGMITVVLGAASTSSAEGGFGMMLLSDGACDYLTVELSLNDTLTVRHITSCEDPLGVELGSVPFDLDEDAVYSLIAELRDGQLSITAGNSLMMDPLLTISTEEHNLRTSGQYGLWARGAVRVAFMGLRTEFIASDYHQLRYTFSEDFPTPTRCDAGECFGAQIQESSVVLTPRCDEDESALSVTCTGFAAPESGDYEVSLEFSSRPDEPFVLARPPAVIHVE